MQHPHDILAEIELSADDFRFLRFEIERSGALVPAFVPAPVGLLDPRAILHAQYQEGRKVVIVPDRNLVGRMAKVAHHGFSTDAAKRRPEEIAVNIMALAQSFDIQINPTIAMHELAHKLGNSAAHLELAKFRSADANHHREWVDLALGRRRDLTDVIECVEETNEDLAYPLNLWNRNYVVLMKIGLLELMEGVCPRQKMLFLLEWLYKDFSMAGPAALFASMYFSPNANKRGMIKQLRSVDREKAINGLKNAAWDVTHLSVLAEEAGKSDVEMTRIIFATADVALSKVAPLLFRGIYPDQGQPPLSVSLNPWWGGEAATIAAMLVGASDLAVANPDRPRPRTMDSGNFIQSSISAFERAIRQWSPDRGSKYERDDDDLAYDPDGASSL